MNSTLRATPSTRSLSGIALRPVVTWLMLVGAMLLAVQMRLLLPFGETLPADYHAQSPGLYALLAMAVLLVELVVPALRVPPQVSRAQYALAVLIATLGSAVAFRDLSPLQLGYFAGASALLYALVIVLPRRIYVGHEGSDIPTDLRRLWNNRALVQLWVTHNIRSRYSQAVLGILWIVLLPLLMALVLAFAFTQFLRIQFDVPIVSFFLSGLVAYNLFSAGVANSTSSVLARLGIVTQVYFPREVLVLITLGEGLVDFAFTFAAMVVVNAAYGILPNVHYIYLPAIVLILIVLTLGFMLIISSLSVLVRDVPQLVAVALQLLFYLTPIVYSADNLPPQLRFVFVLNPMASIVQAFRDIVLYARPPNFVTLYYPLVLSVVVLYLGYCIFKSIEGTMADML